MKKIIALLMLAAAGSCYGATIISSPGAAAAFNDTRYGYETGTMTISTTTTNIDFSAATSWTLTLGTNTTVSFTNLTSGYDQEFSLTLVQDATGSRTVTWPAAVNWPFGIAPVLTTTANAVDIIRFRTTDGGTTIYGFVAGYDMK